MNIYKSLGIFTIFTGGFAAGAFFMHQYLSNKAYNQFEEELEAMKEFYEKGQNKAAAAEDAVKALGGGEVEESKENRIFRSTLEKTGYDKMFTSDLEENNAEETDHPREDPAEPQPPYIITPEEFVESGYSKSTLTYYEKAGVLTEDDDVLENIEYIVGREFVDRFGEYEEDVVYVRNEKMSTDFEIICDHSDADTVTEILGYEEIEEEE